METQTTPTNLELSSSFEEDIDPFFDDGFKTETEPTLEQGEAPEFFLEPEPLDTVPEQLGMQSGNFERRAASPAYSHLAESLGPAPEYYDYRFDAEYNWHFDLGTERVVAGLFLGSETILDSLLARGFYQEHFQDTVNKQAKTGIYHMDRHGHIRLTILAKDIFIAPTTHERLVDDLSDKPKTHESTTSNGEGALNVIDMFKFFEQKQETTLEAQTDRDGLRGWLSTSDDFFDDVPVATPPSQKKPATQADADPLLAPGLGWQVDGSKIRTDSGISLVATTP